MTSQPVCVAPTGDVCGEGAVWHAAHAAVYWTDINRFLIHRFTLADQCVRTWFFEEPVTALALTDRDDVLAVLVGSGVILWEPASDVRHPRIFSLEGWPSVRLNDGRADPRGYLWVGSMRNNVSPDGSSKEAGGRDGILYRLNADRIVTVQRRDVGISNTVAWSPDHRRFYFGDTLANMIWSYDFDAGTGTISNETPFFRDFERGLPDGSTVDAEGYLWNCRYDGSCIVRVAPDGSIAGVLETPVKNPTTCAFGGDNLSTLFFTAAESAEGEPQGLAGSLFSLRVPVRGLPVTPFRL